MLRKIRLSLEEKTDIKNLINLEIQFYRDSVKCIKNILNDKKLDTWDNKVFNKRFKEYLDQFENENISIWVDTDKDIKFYCKNRGMKSCYSSCWNYINNDTYYIINQYSCKYIDTINSNRIIIDELKSGLKNILNKLEEKIASLENGVKKIDEIIKRYNEILEELKVFNDTLDYSIKDYLKIDSSVF